MSTLADIRRAVQSRERSAREVCDEALERLERRDPEIHAFVETFPEQAREQARIIDAALERGEPVGPLAGVPVALKDNLCLQWGRTTCGSRMLADYRSPFSAHAVQKIIEAGAVIIGKTNLDEFAMGSSTEHSAFGPTRNPWDHERVPGGSSGGSAAAVAAGIVPVALGSDTGGSIRQPAAHCGVVGLKPTYGRVSRWGLVAFASSLDQIGPLTTTVEDAAIMLEVIAGMDARDATSAPQFVPAFARSLDATQPSTVIGIPRQARSAGNHPAVAAALDDAAAALRAAGAQLVDVELPLLDEGVAAYYLIAPAEASSNLARYDGVRFGRREPLPPDAGLDELYARSRGAGFGAEVQRRIMLGTFVLSAGYAERYYHTAQRVRRLIRADFERVFSRGVHAILTPTTPGPAFPLGAKLTDPLSMYLEDVYTVGANLAGLPAISVPAGRAHVGVGAAARQLPVAVQLTGRAFEEADLLRIARMIERAGLGVAAG